MAIVIIKSDGKETPNKMPQHQAEVYLGNLIFNDRIANLKQCMNDVTGGRGKATAAFTFKGKSVLHASSGNGEKSITLFFYSTDTDQYIFAMGEHVDATTYRISVYGQPEGTFRKGRTLQL